MIRASFAPGSKPSHPDPGSAEPRGLSFSGARSDELRGLRKVALRMGEIPTRQVRWQLEAAVLKDLTNGRRRWEDLTDADFRPDLRRLGSAPRAGPVARPAPRGGLRRPAEPDLLRSTPS
jgi:hypothetical protein